MEVNAEFADVVLRIAGVEILVGLVEVVVVVVAVVTEVVVVVVAVVTDVVLAVVVVVVLAVMIFGEDVTVVVNL